MLFEEINEQLESMNIKVKQAECAILDATIIESSARLRKTLVVPEKDRQRTKNFSSYGPVEKWEMSTKFFKTNLK